MGLPSGNLRYLLNMAIYSGFTVSNENGGSIRSYVQLPEGNRRILFQRSREAPMNSEDFLDYCLGQPLNQQSG